MKYRVKILFWTLITLMDAKGAIVREEQSVVHLKHFPTILFKNPCYTFTFLGKKLTYIFNLNAAHDLNPCKGCSTGQKV